MKRTWSLVLAATLFAGVSSVAGGCSLVFGIHEIPEGSGGAGGTPHACGPNVACDNTNPCSPSTCQDGFCVTATLPDGLAPESTQIAANCKKAACVDGVVQQLNDDQDIEDDDEPCTVDSCSGGNAFHTAKPDSTGCSKGPSQGLCGSGVCQILCVSDTACNDQNPCTTDVCELTTSICTFTPLNGVNTPGFTQIDGDCRIQVCVEGVSTDSPDDTDLPKTATPCDSEICTSGVPSNPPLAVDTPCAKSPAEISFCDGAGACVECTANAQCGASTDCLKHICTAGVCAAVPAPVNTHVAMQTDGDCHAVACDGAGAVLPQPIIDDTDVKNDNNDCTTDGCTNGALTSTTLPAGTACGNGQQCNAAGQCGCSNNAQCNAPATCGGGNPGTPFTCGCTKTTCALLGATCGTPPDACGSTLSCNTGTKNGNETDIDCGGGGNCTTPCAQGKQCSMDTDCGTGHCADGVCCNTACSGLCMACSAAKKGVGADGTCGPIAANQQDTTAPQTCMGVSVCDGAGSCKKINGQSCVVPSQCASGTCLDGVCCGSATCPTCQSCALSGNGTCSNIANGTPDTVPGGACTTSCNGSGVCKTANGNACPAGGATNCQSGLCADGVCCSSTCNASNVCMTCNGATPGTCAVVKDADDVDSCNAATSTCSDLGACLSKPGQPCMFDGQCASGICNVGIVCQ